MIDRKSKSARVTRRPAFPPERPVLRADAELNRGRLLEAARWVVINRGIDFDVSEVASRAEVGRGTVYRNFATKDGIIETVVAEICDDFEQFISGALEESDAKKAFQELIEDQWEFSLRYAHVKPEVRARIYDMVQSRPVWREIQRIVESARESGIIDKNFSTGFILKAITSLAMMGLRPRESKKEMRELSTKLLTSGFFVR